MTNMKKATSYKAKYQMLKAILEEAYEEAYLYYQRNYNQYAAAEAYMYCMVRACHNIEEYGKDE